MIIRLDRFLALTSVIILTGWVQSPFFNQKVEAQANPYPTQSIDLMQHSPTVESPFTLMETEGFEGLKIDLTEAEVLGILGSPKTQGDKILWGADGLYHQSWYYPEQGITLDMVSETTKDQQKIGSIKLTSPSTLKTQRGIGIGDSYETVQEAYQDVEEQGSYFTNKIFVAGSVYGGLIFSFENNCVVEIFLGAAAE